MEYVHKHSPLILTGQEIFLELLKNVNKSFK